VRVEGTLFDELFEVFGERAAHGACLASHNVGNIRNYCDLLFPL
jgi:hypothetical protein